MLELKNLRQSYKYYKTHNKKGIDLRRYMYIVTGFTKFMMKKLLLGFEVKLGPGESLGTLYVRGYDIKPKLHSLTGEICGMVPAWQKTLQYWRDNPEAKAKKELVYCFNEHTNGVVYRIKWNKENVKLHNIRLYKLKVARANKVALHKLACEGYEFLTIHK